MSQPRPGFVTGYNPVPMANTVATLGSQLRQRLLFLLLALVGWSALWFWQRDRWGSPWLLLAGYATSIVLIGWTALRLASARHHLGRIGSGPALEAGRVGLVLHTLDQQRREVPWGEVTAVRVAGRMPGAGPQIVVETAQGRVWAVPLSFLDALPGTIDGGLRACSAGRVGLDLSGLDNLI